jgi:hypothetical protein
LSAQFLFYKVEGAIMKLAFGVLAIALLAGVRAEDDDTAEDESVGTVIGIDLGCVARPF